MKQIRTITINPSFDLHYSIPDFAAGRENSVAEVSSEATGKGINTSRALVTNGVPNLAYLIMGKESEATFLAELDRDGIRYRCVTVPGRIRENITVHPAQGRETRILLNTFSVSEEAFARLESDLLAEDLPELLVSFSGRLPKGIEKNRVRRMLDALIAGGAKLVIDSISFTPDDLKQIRPWIIKPNEQEIEGFLGETPKTPEEAANAARRMVQNGVSETVMISLGGDGAVWSDGERTCVLRVPRLENPVSTIGAGDSTIAGLLAGVAEGREIGDALRLAVSYGTAACMTPGTHPPKPGDVREVYEKVRVEWG